VAAATAGAIEGTLRAAIATITWIVVVATSVMAGLGCIREGRLSAQVLLGERFASSRAEPILAK
jgi:hypothetical protein